MLTGSNKFCFDPLKKVLGLQYLHCTTVMLQNSAHAKSVLCMECVRTASALPDVIHT